MDGKRSVLIDRKKIIETYERIEKEIGESFGMAGEIINRVAQELDLARYEVKETMISHWTNQGAG